MFTLGALALCGFALLALLLLTFELLRLLHRIALLRGPSIRRHRRCDAVFLGLLAQGALLLFNGTALRVLRPVDICWLTLLLALQLCLLAPGPLLGLPGAALDCWRLGCKRGRWRGGRGLGDR